MSDHIQAEALRGARRKGQDAPLKRRLVAKILTSWQPMMGAATLRKDTFLHRTMAFWTPRLAQYLLPLGEKAESASQPRKYRGWERVKPKEILVRPPFQETAEHADLALEVEHGALPKGLQGHVFFQSFANEVLHELRFMSRPILVRVDFEERDGAPAARLTAKKIWTPAHVFKQHADGTPDRFRFLRSLLWISASGGMQGDHGTGIVTVDDALLLTANTSNPVVVDKRTLEVVAPFGRAEDYYPAVPWAAPFPPRYMSAHGFYDDHTGEFFSVNYGYGFVRIVAWKAGDPAIRSYLLTDANGKPLHIKNSCHQLMVSKDFVIVFNNDGHLLDFPNPFAQDSFVIMAPRAQMTGDGGSVRCLRVELPMTASHTIANYDNPDGVVTFFTAGTVAFAPDMSGIMPNDVAKATGQYYSDQYWGTFPISQSDIGHMARYTIDTRAGKLVDFKKVYDPKLTWDAQYASTKGGMGIRQEKDGPGTWDKFYATFFGFKKSSVISRMNDIFETTKYTQYTWDELPEEPVPGALVAVDTKTWEIVDSFSFPQDAQPGHACNVPDADGKTWFFVPVQDAGGDRFYVFDPDRLAAGPVCVLRSPELLPYMQHPTWAKDLETTRARYEVDLEKDLLPEGVVPSVEKIIRERVLPRFAKKG